MSVLKPSYAIKIGSEDFKPETGNVKGFRVSLSMSVPAGSFELVLNLGDKSLRVKRGDEVSVQLGYGDKLKDAFKGFVENIEPGISEIRITGPNSASKLLELRANQVYENQSASDIVSDLAQKAGVQTDDVSSGISFPMYVVDDTKNAYEHMKDLADKCGFDVYVTGGNRLVFKKHERKDPRALKYGSNIIDVETYDWKPSFGRVVIYGEGAASYKGADTAHWFTKKQVEGVSGSGTSLLLHDPVVRDKDTAEKVAKARIEAISKSVCGVAKIIGDAEVKLGETIKFEGMKDDRLDREFQVRAVEHIMNKDEGFVTLIGWRA